MDASPSLSVGELTAGLADYISPDSWDVLILGDGSGSYWGRPGGWASVILDRSLGGYKVLCGAINDTTINICELMPTLYSLHWYHCGPGRKLQHARAEPVRVSIVSDCRIICDQGNHLAARDRNEPLWLAIDRYQSLNYDLAFRYVDRELLFGNRVCDRLSKTMRKLVEAVEQHMARLDVGAELLAVRPRRVLDGTTDLSSKAGPKHRAGRPSEDPPVS
jgi:hypothetical protein